jgi:hypothetical protein
MDYILNMEGYLKALTTLDLFMAEISPRRDEDPRKPRGPMTDQDKVDLVTKFAQLVDGDCSKLRSMVEDDPIIQDVEEWIGHTYECSERKREQATKIAEWILDDPETATAVVLNRSVTVPVFDVLLKENGLHKVTLSELHAWVCRKFKKTVDVEYVEQQVDLWLGMYEDERRVEIKEGQRSGASVNALARKIGYDAMQSLRLPWEGNGKTAAMKLAVSGVKTLLGVKRSKLDDKGPYNIPQSRHLIHQNWTTIVAYVRNRLIDELPELEQLRNFTATTEIA